MNDKFNKEIEILKKNQIEILEMKSTINQIKYSVEMLTDQMLEKMNFRAGRQSG